MFQPPGRVRCRVFDEDLGVPILQAEDVSGFFVDSQGGYSDVVFVNVHELDGFRRTSESTELHIMDFRGRKVGEYYVGRVAFSGPSPWGEFGFKSSVSCRSFGHRCEYFDAKKIWSRWTSGEPLKFGEWAEWPKCLQNSWLHVVQNSWFSMGKEPGRYGASASVRLDGSNIRGKSGFYCAIGEAVNGPGGYYGSNLDALASCISSEDGLGPLVDVSWENFQVSQKYLSSEFLDSVLSVFSEFGISVNLGRNL